MNEPNDYFGLRSRGITLWSVAVILALGTPLTSVAATASPQITSQATAAVTPRIKIQKINIQGNHGLTTAQIKGAMKLIKEGSSSSVPVGTDTTNLKLQDDLTRIRMLYAEHGYARVADSNVNRMPTSLRRHRIGQVIRLWLQPLNHTAAGVWFAKMKIVDPAAGLRCPVNGI